MNRARIKRWLKTGKLLPDLADIIRNIKNPMQWLLITEPWCGDAAHSHAFIEKLSGLNELIQLEIQNRDATGSEIEQYLTNGTKSIPILVVRDAKGKDLFTWGPRPKEAQEMFLSQKKASPDRTEDDKRALQKWYNKNKGVDIQEELIHLFRKLS